jgi:hypothetical protein
MVRVARVPETEQQADEQDDPDADLSVREPFEPAVYSAPLASAFQRSPHQIALMLPGEINVYPNRSVAAWPDQSTRTRRSAQRRLRT